MSESEGRSRTETPGESPAPSRRWRPEPWGAKGCSLSKPNRVSDKKEQESMNECVLSDTRELDTGAKKIRNLEFVVVKRRLYRKNKFKNQKHIPNKATLLCRLTLILLDLNLVEFG